MYFIACLIVNPHGEFKISNSPSNSTCFLDLSFLFSLFCCLTLSCHSFSPSVNVGRSGTKCPIPPHFLHLFFLLLVSNAFIIVLFLLLISLFFTDSLLLSISSSLLSFSSFCNFSFFCDSEFNLLLFCFANLSILRYSLLSNLSLLLVLAFLYFS